MGSLAALAERHNGVWGGCWCTWFHRPFDDATKALGGRAVKQRLVEAGRAHAALVFDGDEAVAWCEYGSVEELPNIYHRKEWEAGVVRKPDYRLTCLFVDRRYRRQGVAAVAVQGALELIARAGGGLVEFTRSTSCRARKPRPRSCATRRAACTSAWGSRTTGPRA